MTAIVLHHGILIPGRVQFAGRAAGPFVGIDRVFAARGYMPLVTRVHPTASVARRAAELKRLILDRCGRTGEPVVIVAHSMGGLDARYMLAHLGMARRVAAVVTVSTPHRGSPYADWCLRHLGRFGAMRVFQALGLDVSGANDLTADACARFNDRTPDAPGVRYFSVTAARPFWQVSPLLFQPYRVVHAAEGENDGLVSVQSATWGEHLGTWPADHLHLLNRRLTIELPRAATDILMYYDCLLDRLEAEGVLSRPAPNDDVLSGSFSPVRGGEG